ncbi:hypothetical protein ACFFLS_23925 [Flavobacterium procerum]|uniref:Uncharacterized protein n=1 Tax=Flavobacterium procerum TaxID=1455569 RepID=A0ABV6C1D6_9FLAO
MPNITREEIENEYRKAIRNKYEIEKDGSFSHYLDNPTQANLRDLCWEVFNSRPNSNDLNIYRSFFKFEFDERNEDISVKFTDKFRKVKDFYLGTKNTAKISTVDLAAILVNFEPRPFRKFRDRGFVNIDEPMNDIHQPAKNPYLPELVLVKNEDEKQIESNDDCLKEESSLEELLEDEILNQEEEFWQDEIFNDASMPNENLGFNTVLDENSKQVKELVKEEKIEEETAKAKEIFFRRILKKSKLTIAATAIIFVLIATGSLATVIYFNFFQKECMQWSGDHYEEVSCNLEIQGIGTYNSPQPYDQRIINLKKIKVCDTTVFFKNEKAVVWYTKVGDSVEFFNTHGIHPENGKALRPVTQYIIGKYVTKDFDK